MLIKVKETKLIEFSNDEKDFTITELLKQMEYLKDTDYILDYVHYDIFNNKRIVEVHLYKMIEREETDHEKIMRLFNEKVKKISPNIKLVYTDEQGNKFESEIDNPLPIRKFVKKLQSDGLL